MDLLKDLVSKKRKQLEENSVANNGTKFYKRGELIKKQEEDYWKRQAEKDAKKNAKLSSQNESDRDHSDDSSNIKNLINKDRLHGDLGKEDEIILPRKDVIKRLRERGQPILLFAELESDAFRRLRRLEIQEPDISRGFRNDFQVSIISFFYFVNYFFSIKFTNSCIFFSTKTGSNGKSRRSIS